MKILAVCGIVSLSLGITYAGEGAIVIRDDVPVFDKARGEKIVWRLSEETPVAGVITVFAGVIDYH